ncbi:1-aminocyclopropane-1-carboxylate synthase 7-like protein [Tanacetum coccineum]
MASFMEQVRGGKAKFNPDRVVLTAGATTVNELLTFILANPGDALLVPTPYYPGSYQTYDRCVKQGVDRIHTQWTYVTRKHIHISAPDGLILVSVGADETLRFWQIFGPGDSILSLNAFPIR